MPAGVKEFIEHLEPLCGKCKDKTVGFIIQFGYPEAMHARPIECYLEELISLLGCNYSGTVLKGGCDGWRWATKKAYSRIYPIGEAFGKSGVFDKKQIIAYEKPERMRFIRILFLRLYLVAVNKFYWGEALRKNGALKSNSIRPYM